MRPGNSVARQEATAGRWGGLDEAEPPGVALGPPGVGRALMGLLVCQRRQTRLALVSLKQPWKVLHRNGVSEG